jgi:hypothetical protein
MSLVVRPEQEFMSLLAFQMVEVGPVGPLGETYRVNILNILDLVKLQLLNRVLMDK